MKLIDADSLIIRIRESYCDACDDYDDDKCGKCEFNYAISAINDEADENRIDPAVHGRWIPDRSGLMYKCSECNYKAKRKDCAEIQSVDLDLNIINGVPKFKFCPNCGAKMDGR